MNRSLILLSTQRALLGTVTPNMKAITIGYDKTSFILRVYFSSQPSEKEMELLTEITSEIAVDVPNFTEFKEEAIVSEERPNKLEKLDEWVYRQFTPLS